MKLINLGKIRDQKSISNFIWLRINAEVIRLSVWNRQINPTTAGNGLG